MNNLQLEFFINWANQNSGFLQIILFLIALIIGWLSGFFKWIFNKLKHIFPHANIGRSVNVVKNTSTEKRLFIQKGGKNSKNIQGENIILNKYSNDN